MTEETKARLRALAAKKKAATLGRTNLKSLDYATGMVGFDHVMDQQYHGPLPAVKLFADGRMTVPDGPIQKRLFLPDTGMYTVVPTYYLHGENSLADRPCNWVRLRHCRPWQTAELANRWPVRKVSVLVYRGPVTGQQRETVTLHPLPVMVAWLRFLWPAENDWVPRAQKYLVGYTDRYVHDRPGVGARIVMRQYRQFPTMEPAAAWTGVVSERTSADWFTLDLPDGDHPEKIVVGYPQDRWDVLD